MSSISLTCNIASLLNMYPILSTLWVGRGWRPRRPTWKSLTTDNLRKCWQLYCICICQGESVKRTLHCATSRLCAGLVREGKILRLSNPTIRAKKHVTSLRSLQESSHATSKYLSVFELDTFRSNPACYQSRVGRRSLIQTLHSFGTQRNEDVLSFCGSEYNHRLQVGVIIATILP